MKKKMQLTSTQLPDKRYYETFNDKNERDIRLNQLRALRRSPESGEYQSANGIIYYIVYK